jgi:hypothetical protein
VRARPRSHVAARSAVVQNYVGVARLERREPSAPRNVPMTAHDKEHLEYIDLGMPGAQSCRYASRRSESGADVGAIPAP